jgi:hypothetical protein
MKLFMDTFHIPYADVEDELTIYITMGLIYKIVLSTLMLYQMA